LGTTSDRMNLNDSGWGIVLGWSIWFWILIMILESLKYLYDEENQGNFRMIRKYHNH
jgi:hypothetical protein